ncbi:MAG: FAD-dependent oxidoreductase [Clostridiales bacterium]|jgi:uncharacterized FAD-dependent dehydrogenase|nr:FAD-dependent oxidoreductase [Clostridiales bacterium]
MEQYYDVVIIGAGPAGIFAALELARLKAGLSVLMVDAGRNIDDRSCPAREGKKCAGCKPCSIMSGWSGAGAFSDGKLSLSDGVGGNIVDYLGKAEANELIGRADGFYMRFGAPEAVHGRDDRKVEELRYEASKHSIQLIPCPVRHMGTENAFEVLRRMYKYLEAEPWFEFCELTEALGISAEGPPAGVAPAQGAPAAGTPATGTLSGGTPAGGASRDGRPAEAAAQAAAQAASPAETPAQAMAPAPATVPAAPAPGNGAAQATAPAPTAEPATARVPAPPATGDGAAPRSWAADGAPRARGVTLRLKDGSIREVAAGAVVAAPGRGGAEWLKGVADRHGIPIKNNEVDIGLRVEVPNAIMDRLTRHLYEAKLVYYSDTFESKVRTFCMNPGGIVSAEHYEGGLAVVNGHSYSDPALRTRNTNFALLVSTRFTHPFSQPIEYGKYIASLGNMLTGGGIMVQRLGDLLMGRRSDPSRLKKSTTEPTLASAIPGDLSFVLPHRHLTSIIESLAAFDKLAPGLNSNNTLLYGVEVKFYSSKVEVDGRFRTNIGGLYAVGDGAGITRGLMQASVTGIAVARDIAASCGKLA